MEPDEVAKRLFGVATTEYGDKYVEHVLEQYKLYVEGMDKVSDRRQKTNEFFLALNTALLGLLGFADAKYTQRTSALLILGPLAGLLLCFFWFSVIKSYRGLNTGKFAVIHAVERRLPLALYATEWDVIGRGSDGRRYRPITHVEIWVPWIFFAVYLVVLATNIPWHSVPCLCHR